MSACDQLFMRAKFRIVVGKPEILTVNLGSPIPAHFKIPPFGMTNAKIGSDFEVTDNAIV